MHQRAPCPEVTGYPCIEREDIFVAARVSAWTHWEKVNGLTVAATICPPLGFIIPEETSAKLAGQGPEGRLILAGGVSHR